MFKIFPKKRLTKLAILFLLFMAVLCTGFIIGKVNKLNQLQAILLEKSQLIMLTLSSELAHFSNIAKIYSQNHELVNFLATPQPSTRLTQINQQLEEIAEAAHASDVYILDRTGKVVATSNWQKQASFFQNNFSFRLYCQQALALGQGFELALGKVSKKRGAYFSSAIKINDNVIGVLVVKADISKMEKSEHLFPLGSPFSFIIQNDEDIVFLSDQLQWRLKSLADNKSSPVDNNLNIKISPLWQSLGYPVWSIPFEQNNRRWLVQQHQFTQYPWKISLLGHSRPSTQDGLFLAITFGMAYIAIGAFFLFYRERRRNVAQLQLSHQNLSKQVTLRTKDLTYSNQQLSTEVEQRKSAEAELISAQEQLIQAAKLATIGQLSSSINHELNQPIAALYSFLQTTDKMLEKGMYNQASANIKRMYGLTDRLTSIVAQFKNFSRKTAHPFSYVSIHNMVNNATAIVNHHASAHGVEIKLKLLLKDVTVHAEPYQLEQVIVNLLTNAVDAMLTTPKPSISISFKRDDKISIFIKDNGPGIKAHYLNQVFEPFFTTKFHSGLGLGLSISRRIIESFQGQLTINNHLNGGVIATIILPITPLIKEQVEHKDLP